MNGEYEREQEKIKQSERAFGKGVLVFYVVLALYLLCRYFTGKNIF